METGTREESLWDGERAEGVWEGERMGERDGVWRVDRGKGDRLRML